MVQAFQVSEFFRFTLVFVTLQFQRGIPYKNYESTLRKISTKLPRIMAATTQSRGGNFRFYLPKRWQSINFIASFMCSCDSTLQQWFLLRSVGYSYSGVRCEVRQLEKTIGRGQRKERIPSLSHPTPPLAVLPAHISLSKQITITITIWMTGTDYQ